MMHRTGILLFALASASPALAQQQRAEDPQDNAAIVVTGTPLAESAKRLKDCIARHCPPKEDIDASLAHAENQFIAGDYLTALLGRTHSILTASQTTSPNPPASAPHM